MDLTIKMKLVNWKYTTAVGLSTILAVTGLVYTHEDIKASNDKTVAYASMVPAAQKAEFATDEKYTPLSGDQYQAYLKAEAERKEKERLEKIRLEKEKKEKEAAEKKAREEEAARKAAEKNSSNSRSSSSRKSSSAPAAGKPAPGSAKAYAADAVASRGWGQDQYNCLVSLWNKESGWNMYAYNSSSGAYGIPQALPGSKMASAGSDWKTNAGTQIEWGLGYIKSRYGTPCGAWGHSQSRGWY